MASWGKRQKPAKGKNFYQSVLPDLYLWCLGQERKLKCHIVSSLPNSDCQGKTLVIDLVSPRKNYCLLVCHILCPEKLAWQLSGWAAGGRVAWSEDGCGGGGLE